MLVETKNIFYALEWLSKALLAILLNEIDLQHNLQKSVEGDPFVSCSHSISFGLDSQEMLKTVAMF